MATLKPKFYKGCQKNGVAKAVIDEQWQVNEASAEYSFNKSHAACYAYISYVTAYLKANHPIEYMSALLSSIMEKGKDKEGNSKVPFYIYETRRMGIEVEPPDINSSFSSFEPSNKPDSIIYGLTAVNHVGHALAQDIAANRRSQGNYTSIWEFCERVPSINKKSLDALVKAGTFDQIHSSRRGLIEIIEPALATAKKKNKAMEKGQDSLFGLLDQNAEQELASLDFLDHPEISSDDWTGMERFSKEREATGLYVSGHPLDHARKAWERVVHAGLGQINQEHVDKTITVCGIVTDKKVRYTKRDNKRMLTIVLEDLTGSKDVVVFPKVLETQDCERLLEPNSLVALQVRVEEDQGFQAEAEAEDENSQEPVERRTKLFLSRAFAFDPTVIEVPEYYEIKVPRSKVSPQYIERLKKILSEYPGEKAVKLEIVDESSSNSYVFGDLRVEPSPTLSQALKNV
jgi:DNA polymerase-3 subunit alpha